MERCARSNCKGPGVLIAGQKIRLCLKHQEVKKQTKYKNRPAHSEMANRRFDSEGERRHGETLLMLQRARAISGLEFQRTFKLEVNGLLVCSYRADFCYTDSAGVFKVVDWKGFETPEFKIKAKLFHAVMGYPITVVKATKEKKRG